MSSPHLLPLLSASDSTSIGATPILARTLAWAEGEVADAAPLVRVFFPPEAASVPVDVALSTLAALDDALQSPGALVLVSHLDAVGDRGGVIIEGPRAPNGATVALDDDEERAFLAREADYCEGRLHHADRQAARQKRVLTTLREAKAPTRGAAFAAATTAELDRERRSLLVSALDGRARARGFRNGRGYLAALCERAVLRRVDTIAVRVPPLGVPREDGLAKKMGVAHLNEELAKSPLALRDVVAAIDAGARRVRVSPSTRIELLPLDDAARAIAVAAKLLVRAPGSPSLGIVTALAAGTEPGAPKPAADKLLTVERLLELLNLSRRDRSSTKSSSGRSTSAKSSSGRSTGAESSSGRSTGAESSSSRSTGADRVLATVDVAPASALLNAAPKTMRRGFSLASLVAKQALGGPARSLVPLVDSARDFAEATTTRVLGDGRDPFRVVAPTIADGDATTRAPSIAPLSQTVLAPGLVESGQRIRSHVLASEGFAPAIDWRRYLLDTHLPALEVLFAREKLNAARRAPMPSFDTLCDLIVEVSEREKNRPALTRFDGEGTVDLDYRFLAPRATAIAARLIAAGVERGDRVVLSGDNHPDWALCAFGVFFAGATLVPLDPALDRTQAAVILRKARPKIAILDAHARTSFGTLLDGAALDGATLDGATLDGAALDGATLDDTTRPALEDSASDNAGDTDADEDASDIPSVRTFDLHLAAASGPGEEGPNPVVTIDESRLPLADDIASILFTSGTTGVPKGVELSHRNFTSLVASLGAVFDMHKGDRSLSLMPMHHTLEFSCGLLLPLAAGAQIHYLDELSPERLAFALKQGRITGMVGVPALWQLLQRRMRTRVDELDSRIQTAFHIAMTANLKLQQQLGLDLGRLVFKPLHDELGGSLRTLISGGAALPPDVHAFFAGIGLHLAEGYGLTESAPVLTVAEGGPGTKSGTCGRPIPGVEIRIEAPSNDVASMDVTSKDVASKDVASKDVTSKGANIDFGDDVEHQFATEDGIVGEVWAKGPNVMRGYFENEDATRAALSDDGWLRTGDLGRLDDGVLTLVGRAKDVVVTATGENIYLDDTEARLGVIEGIAEQTLLGIDDPRGGERLAFAYVPEDGVRDDKAAALVKKALNKLPETFRPQVVAQVPGPLPKTATRKVKRKDVVPLVEAKVAADKANAPAGGPAISAVRGAIAAATGQDVRALSASTDLRADLGFDSLLWVELQESLEPVYGELDADALFACQTVGDVEAHLRAQDGASSTGIRAVGAKSASDRSTVATLGRLVMGRAGTDIDADDDSAPPLRIPSPFVAPMRKALGFAQHDMYRTLFETDVRGRAYIPHNRPTIVVANHTSHLDVGLVKFALGRYGQRLAPLAAKDYFFEGAPLKVAVVEQLTNLVAIERESGSGVAFEQARAAVDNGQVVLIFPEGTRRADGTLGEFRPLVGRLALTCGVDVLPLHLEGAFDALPRGSMMPKSRALSVRIGPPLIAEDMRTLTSTMNRAEAARAATGYIRDAVAALGHGRILELGPAGPMVRNAPVQEGIASNVVPLGARGA